MAKTTLKPSREILLDLSERLSISGMSREFSVSSRTIKDWMEEENIPQKSIGEAVRLGKLMRRPKKEVLMELHEKGMSRTQIANALGKPAQSITRCFKIYGLPLERIKPNKEQLQELNEQGMGINVIANQFYRKVGEVKRFFREYGIERNLNPSSDQLRNLVSKGMNLEEVAEFTGKRMVSVRNLFRKYHLNFDKENSKQNDNGNPLISLISKDERALALSGLVACSSSGNVAVEAENLLFKNYRTMFDNQKSLHETILSSKNEIVELVNKGLTNLGKYLGPFAVSQIGISPILLGSAIEKLEVNSRYSNEVWYSIAREVYGPLFSKEPRETIDLLDKMKDESKNIYARKLYDKLSDHYRKTLGIVDELERENTRWWQARMDKDSRFMAEQTR